MSLGESYEEFIKKFEPKKTTDDCYTPQNIYDVIADWVAETYSVNKDTFVRPFNPGGDYQAEDYSDKIVVDNPPFSILASIIKWYKMQNVKFFLFAPQLTLFSRKDRTISYLPVNANITYHNGANVNTGFITNLGEPCIWSAPTLNAIIREKNNENIKAKNKTKIRLRFPDEVTSAALLGKLATHGVELKIPSSDYFFISQIDAMGDKSIFGGGIMMSERAAAERAAAERAAAERAAAERAAAEEIRYELSEREREMLRVFNKKLRREASDGIYSEID